MFLYHSKLIICKVIKIWKPPSDSCHFPQRISRQMSPSDSPGRNFYFSSSENNFLKHFMQDMQPVMQEFSEMTGEVDKKKYNWWGWGGAGGLCAEWRNGARRRLSHKSCTLPRRRRDRSTASGLTNPSASTPPPFWVPPSFSLFSVTVFSLAYSRFSI